MNVSIQTKFMNTRKAARFLNLSPHTLVGWRQRGVGPPYITLIHSIMYPIGELVAWCQQQDLMDRDGSPTKNEKIRNPGDSKS